jgi:GGDEF domain-containing protein
MIRMPNWALLDCRIQHFDRFREVYGFITGDEVLRFTSLIMGEVVDEVGTPNDFIGHPGGDNFVLITVAPQAAKIRERLKARFNTEVLAHYNFMDRERGYVIGRDSDGKEVQVPLMTLAVGAISVETREFSDIREITEAAAEARRLDAAAK